MTLYTPDPSDPPSKPTINGNPANPVPAGSNVQLTCSATATPGPITGYSWYLDGLQLAESTKCKQQLAIESEF